MSSKVVTYGLVDADAAAEYDYADASESTALIPSSSGATTDAGRPNGAIPLSAEDREVRDLVYALFTVPHYHHQHPKTIPLLCPEVRGKRHRLPIARNMNEFRHWWKTSRLLVRLVGSYQWCASPLNWTAMALLNLSRRKQTKLAIRQAKAIGRGGPNRDFLQDFQPFTRTLRIALATFRALEARVDNRFLEVGIAEAMAFIGNRCFRYWARSIADATAKLLMFPLAATYIAPHLEQQSRPIIILMGLLRAVLPFASSFYGSALGRNLTFNTFSAYHYRWKPIQGIFHFHQHCGVYQDVDPDPFLFRLARKVAEAIGHGDDAVKVRSDLISIGFRTLGAGSGGYAVYRHPSEGVILHVTPYGPSVLNEMPRFVVMERRPLVQSETNPFLRAAAPSAAVLTGFTYSGAFFTSQEWAALRTRFEDEMASYRNACMIMGTNRAHISSTSIEHNELAFPPTDLVSLKAFIRTGQSAWKKRKADRKWKQVQSDVRRMAKAVQQHQHNGTAPKGVILYMEGLDCSGKSSTGGLVQAALEDSGYMVDMRQYNRPPTEEQKRMAWMSRFARPPVQDQEDYMAMVWDRGPVGDFVYGNLNKLSEEDKLKRFAEFRAFDRDCHRNNILFCKLLFVTDKDSIATTLGKRLAHKKIAQDLRVWLDATSQLGHSNHPGLTAIEAHIDPTDFIAFNKYTENLQNFCSVALNTDRNGYDNPWFVVCTSNRHAARLSLMKAVSRQIDTFSKQVVLQDQKAADVEAQLILKGIVDEREHGISLRAIFQAFLLCCLAFAYARQTWHIGIADFD